MSDQSITRAKVQETGTVFVVLPRALLDIFPEAVPEVAVRARTVGDVMEALEARWPGVRDRLCDSTPRIRKHINVFVDGKRARLDTALRDGIKIYILTAISGG
jgi:molybdopterin converting factor small subunit